MNCRYCNEPIDPSELADFNNTMHRECATRAVLGSSGHQLQDCACFGGTREDPPGASLRDGARLAHETYLALQCGLIAPPRMLPGDKP